MELNKVHSDCCIEPIEFIAFVKPYKNMNAIYRCPKCWGVYIR